MKEISKMYGLGISTLREAIKDGRLRAAHIGRRVVIRIEDADAFIAGGEQIAPPGNSPTKPWKGRKR